MLLAVGVVASLLAISAPPHAIAAVDSRFPRVAQLNFTDCNPTCLTGAAMPANFAPKQMTLDVDRRRVYLYDNDAFGFPRGLVIVDPDRKQQTGWIPLSTQLPTDGFTRTAYDAKHGRMFFGEASTAAGCRGTSSAAGCGEPPHFAVIDVTVPNPTATTVSLPRLAVTGQPNDADGLAAMAYDDLNDRLYLLTTGGATFDSTGSFDPKGPSVVAYDATNLTSTSQPLWTYRVRTCPSALNQKSSGPYFDVGNDGSFVYFVCRGTPGVGAEQHGVVRVTFNKSTTTDPTAAFTTDFFHFAGSLGTGWSTGDRAGDRAGIGVGGGGNQRLYIFDAAHGAWVASMLLGDKNIGGAGVDPAMGRMYVASQDQGIRVIDAAAVPAIVQATPINPGYEFGSRIEDFVVDPLTRRAFIAGPTFGDVKNHMWVFEDHTTPYVKPVPVDPDSRTHDLDEADAASVSHTAFGSAYGAHVVNVRGIGGSAVVTNTNDTVKNIPEGEFLRLESGDRGLFFGQVSKAELSGERENGVAAANAVSTKIDDATMAELRGKYSHVTDQFGIGQNQAPPCDMANPESDSGARFKECFAFGHVISQFGQLDESACNDFGNSDDPVADDALNSHVNCTRLDKVDAFATSSFEPTEEVPLTPDGAPQITYRIGRTETDVKVRKNATGGVETTSIAIAKDVVVNVPGLGSLTIGDVRSEAVSRAAGRPGTAASDLETFAKNVRIVNPAGETLFACGVPGVGSDKDDKVAQADPGERCAPADMIAGINRYLAPRIVARGPRQELTESILNSDGGAQAVVQKELYAYINDSTINGDAQREVTGLDLTLYNDSDDASRVTLQLAGVYSEAQYQIGEELETFVEEPAKLSVKLVDGDDQPLAGGTFQLRAAGDVAGLPGALADTCVTAADGIGTCVFEKLEPGDYSVSQTIAPPGYSLAEDRTVNLLSGDDVEVPMVNLRSIGKIEIALSADEGNPLPGAEFELSADNGDLLRGAGDQAVGTCVTGMDGRCGFEDVPLGKYVVHESTAPDGYLVADDAGFELSEPGQVAQLDFTTGLKGVDGAGSEDEETSGDTGGEQSRDTAFVDEPTDTATVDMYTPPPAPLPPIVHRNGGGGGIARTIRALPTAAAEFLRRKPGQAVLFGLVWLLLLSPLYLVTRRRSLYLAKVSF